MNGDTRYKHLVGIPYSEQHCFLLAKKFYKDVFNIELKHYCEDVPVKRSDVENLIFSNVGDFKKVDKPKFGDLVLLQVHGFECHIGIHIDEDHFLHASRINGSVLDRYSKWKTLISGYYRLKEIQ